MRPEKKGAGPGRGARARGPEAAACIQMRSGGAHECDSSLACLGRKADIKAQAGSGGTSAAAGTAGGAALGLWSSLLFLISLSASCFLHQSCEIFAEVTRFFFSRLSHWGPANIFIQKSLMVKEWRWRGNKYITLPDPKACAVGTQLFNSNPWPVTNSRTLFPNAIWGEGVFRDISSAEQHELQIIRSLQGIRDHPSSWVDLNH